MLGIASHKQSEHCCCPQGCLDRRIACMGGNIDDIQQVLCCDQGPTAFIATAIDPLTLNNFAVLAEGLDPCCGPTAHTC